MPKSKTNDRRPGFVYVIDNTAQFKDRNLTGWDGNAELWLQGNMRHVEDVFDTVVLMLAQVLQGYHRADGVRLVDAGCGEGWALRALEAAKFKGSYVGVDVTRRFISTLAGRHQKDRKRSFRHLDLEAPLPLDLRGTFDIALNCFNLFELPQLGLAFANLVAFLKPHGWLMIAHIDPMSQLLAVSASIDELRSNLRLYEQHRAQLGYDKEIDVAGKRSGRYYRGVLYSVADYFQCAASHGLRCESMQEIVKTGNAIPQVYQLMLFRKG